MEKTKPKIKKFLTCVLRYDIFDTIKGKNMITNYFEDLWKKAEKLGISRHRIGCKVFGKDNYRMIYKQGQVSKYMQKRYEEIDNAINELRKEK